MRTKIIIFALFFIVLSGCASKRSASTHTVATADSTAVATVVRVETAARFGLAVATLSADSVRVITPAGETVTLYGLTSRRQSTTLETARAAETSTDSVAATSVISADTTTHTDTAAVARPANLNLVWLGAALLAGFAAALLIARRR